MKIHLTIEISDAEILPLLAKLSGGKVVSGIASIATANVGMKPVPDSAGPARHKLPAVPLTPPLPDSTLAAQVKKALANPPKDLRCQSGPRFDPLLLRVIASAPEPFTRAAIASVSGMSAYNVSMRFIRMRKRGWIEKTKQGFWRRTKTFGQY